MQLTATRLHQLSRTSADAVARIDTIRRYEGPEVVDVPGESDMQPTATSVFTSRGISRADAVARMDTIRQYKRTEMVDVPAERMTLRTHTGPNAVIPQPRKEPAR